MYTPDMDIHPLTELTQEITHMAQHSSTRNKEHREHHLHF